MPRQASVRLIRRHPAKIRVDDEIELRAIHDSDAADLFALTDDGRGSLRRWLPWVDETRTVTDTKRFITKSREQLRRNDGMQLAIRYRGELAGVIGYHYWDWTTGKTEIGYWLAPRHERKGIMTRSCGALVDYAFESLGLNRVEIRAAVGNVRSRAIPERLGFHQEGILREGERTADGPADQVVYGLLRAERHTAGRGPRRL